MSAKLLQALSDENPDLQKQIGCMTGIFQLFDRHHALSGKRINAHATKRLLSGHHLNGTNIGADATCSTQTSLVEDNVTKNLNENQRNSAESSRISSSSSCSSSFSSLECDKTAQSEPASFESTALETSSRNSLASKNLDVDNRDSIYSVCSDPLVTCALSCQESLGLRNVVKESSYGEAPSFSVKTTAREESNNNGQKYRDSPRPLHLSKSVDGSCIKGKPKSPLDLNESLKVLAKLKETPWYYNDLREIMTPSGQTEDSSSFSISKDAPRFSYDSRDISKGTMKLRELPRLSLDSRQGSMNISRFDRKPGKSNPILELIQEQELQIVNRPPSVVAKLMGLEAMPNSGSATHGLMGLMKSSSDDDYVFPREMNNSQSFKISKSIEGSKQDQNSQFPKSSIKDPSPSKRRSPGSVMKPVSCARFPVETAPWRQLYHIPQKLALRNQDGLAGPSTSVSVYSDVEKRLKELEFQKSGKDLRALKQILGAMHAKGLLERKRIEDKVPHFQGVCTNQNTVGAIHNTTLANRRSLRGNRFGSSPIKGSNSISKSFESPIVIMKPAKLINRCMLPSSSVIRLDGLSSVNKFRGASGKRMLPNTRTAKDLTPKPLLKEPITSNSPSDKKSSGKKDDSSAQKHRVRLVQISSRPQCLTQENTGGSSIRNSGPLSPRLQQKRVDLDKRSRPIPSVNLCKARRQPLRPQSEPGSHSERHRSKEVCLHQFNDQSSKISSETRKLSHREDHISVYSHSNITLASQVDLKVTTSDQSSEMNFLEQSNQYPSQRAAGEIVSSFMKKELLSSLSEDALSVETVTIVPEQPSPVSVLDSTFYKDDIDPSPVKITGNTFKNAETQVSNGISVDESWNHGNNPDFSYGINLKKLENIECLVEKLRRLNSAHDKVAKDHIASLCEDTNPDHRYVSEVMLASGLLLKDLSSGHNQIQLHSSGQPINPDLFLVLEQTKLSWISKTESIHKNLLLTNKEKLHRKLLFDTINEILIQKLALAGAQPEPWLQPTKLAGLPPSGQRLLKEVCLEIDLLLPKGFNGCLEESDHDGLKLILSEDVMHRTENWKDFHKEVSSMVLDIERQIFKDLVDEIVNVESSSTLHFKPNRRRRQLFVMEP